MKNKTKLFTIVFIAILFCGWGYVGHRIISIKAVAAFPSQMNNLTSWETYLADSASAADNRKSWDNTEGPKHFIDIDNYDEFNNTGRVIQDYDSLVAKYGNSYVISQGVLPWAIINTYDSLKAQFSRRDWEEAKHTAAYLGHYVADSHMPLHITRNYDGQITGQTGLHSRYEGTMIGDYESSIQYTPDTGQYISDVPNFIFSYIYYNHSYVDSLLEADNTAKTYAGGSTSNNLYYQKLWELTGNFTISLFSNASTRLASLIYTAWVNAGSPNPSVTISEARKDDNKDLIPDHKVTGDTLMITGVITSPSLSTSNTTYFVQDETAGIQIFSYHVLPAADIHMGDSVFVIGTLDQYRGLDEFVPLNAADSNYFGVLKHDATMPTPMKLTLAEFVANSENYEGMLIEVDTLYKASGTWPSASSNGRIYVTNAGRTDTALMFISSYTNIGGSIEPSFPIDLVGIGNQYSSGSSVYDDGYEISPRDTNDIRMTHLTPQVSIAEARKDDNNDLIPDYKVSGDTLMITGVITSPSLSTSNTTYFVQDETAGIEIFSYHVLPSADIHMGDSVFVIGTLDQYRGLDEFVPLNAADSNYFGVLKHDAIMPTPTKLTLAEFVAIPENYEGMLIEVDTLYKVSGTWPSVSSNGYINVRNASSTDTTLMFISSYTNIGGSTEPSFPIDLVGIGNQYSSGSSVYNDGYEISPRDTSDIRSTTLVGIENTQDKVYTFKLYQNFPNPFNPSTIIRFELPSAQRVELTIFDILGRKVRTLYNDVAPQGITKINFDASGLASGVYIYRIKTNLRVISKKLMLLR